MMIRLIRKIFGKGHFILLRLKIRGLSSSAKMQKVRTMRFKESDRDLKECYLQYITNVSSANMAASFECCLFLERLCSLFSCAKILDFGSGFSSFTFRRYALSHANIEVWSVDDNANWIEKTAAFLQQQKVGIGNLMMLDEFMNGTEANFDLIFLDLNFVEVRKNFIQLVVNRCKPGGMIVFDDVHKPEFMFDVLRLTRELDVTFFDVSSLTRDEFGRFALLGIRNS